MNADAFHRRSAQLRQQITDQEIAIEALNRQIRVLEQSERRLKTRLCEEKEFVKDIKAEFEAAQNEALILAERLHNEKVNLKESTRDLERYRGWWLNEYYSLKVALQMIPDEDLDDGVQAMAASSHAQFVVHEHSCSS